MDDGRTFFIDHNTQVRPHRLDQPLQRARERSKAERAAETAR
jgi:hypothetical protein